MPSRLRAGLFVLSMTFWAPQVFAQSDDARAAARATATDGLHAMDEGRWADAERLFAHAEALLHAPPHLLYYARASVKQGKLVQANEAYLKILRETLSPSAPRAFVEAQSAAATEQPKVEQSLPHLTITVEGEKAKEAHVSVNGAEISQALIGISAPHDPGDLTIEAIAPGWRSEKTTLTLKESARETVTLKLTIQDAAAMPKTIAPTVRPAKTGLRAVGWVSLIFGAGGIGVGTYFMIDNRNNRDAANALCNLPNGVCPSSQRATIQAYDSTANTSAIISWVSYSAGAAFAGAGLIMLLASRGGSEPTAPPKSGFVVHPWVGFGSGGLSGSF